MPRATVFTDPENEEPRALTDREKKGIAEGVSGLVGDESLSVELDDLLPYPLAEYQIVSEYSLLVAVKALQHIERSSRCHNSRVVATEALQAVGMCGDLTTGEDGKPEPVEFTPAQSPELLPMVQNHYEWLG